MKTIFESLISGLFDLIWWAIALFLSFLIIFFFDENPVEQLFLLPEWSLFALFTFVTTLNKQQTIIKHQENQELKQNMASKMFNFSSLICVFLFALSLMVGRGYVNITSMQSETLQSFNIFIVFVAGVLYLFACYQEQTIIPSAEQ